MKTVLKIGLYSEITRTGENKNKFGSFFFVLKNMKPVFNNTNQTFPNSLHEPTNMATLKN